MEETITILEREIKNINELERAAEARIQINQKRIREDEATIHSLGQQKQKLSSQLKILKDSTYGR